LALIGNGGTSCSRLGKWRVANPFGGTENNRRIRARGNKQVYTLALQEGPSSRGVAAFTAEHFIHVMRHGAVEEERHLAFVETRDGQDVERGPQVDRVRVVALRRGLLVDEHNAAHHVVRISAGKRCAVSTEQLQTGSS
jgi:hypothetical protein